MRKIKLETDKYYHVYNRGAHKQNIFLDDCDRYKFLRKIWELNNETTSQQRDYLYRKIEDVYKTHSQFEVPQFGNELSLFGNDYSRSKKVREYYKQINKFPKIVEIICYCILDNHYHFILRQLVNNGIEIFMRKTGISYSKYFNTTHKRSGVLSERRFEAHPINHEDNLCWLSAYVNCNYEIHKLGKAENWQFSSYRDYLDLRQGRLINKNRVLKLFNNNIQEYSNFCCEVIKESQDIKKVKKLLLS